MQFLYHQNAGESPLTLSDETFHYLFKVRRIAPNEHIKMRNLRDKNLYIYAIAQVQKKIRAYRDCWFRIYKSRRF